MNHLGRFEDYHIRKILRELEEAGIDLTELNIPKIIDETSFQVRSKKYPDECPYYIEGRSCHDIEDLNCFLCVCPEYESEKDEGGCRINNPLGKWHSPYPYSEFGRVWDCSDCSVPHYPEYVERYLRKNLEKLKNI